MAKRPSAELRLAASTAAAKVFGCDPGDVVIGIAPEELQTVTVNWSESMKPGAAVRAAAKQAVLASLPEAYRGYKVMVV